MTKRKIIATPIKGDILDLYGSVKTKRRAVGLKQLRKRMVKSMAARVASEGK